MKLLTTIILLLLSFITVAAGKIDIVALFKNKTLIQINGKTQVLTVGGPSVEGITLISATSKEAVLEIDGVQKTYTLGAHIGSSFTSAEAGTTVTIAPDAQGMYLVNGSINKHQVRFVIDTGATLISMNSHEAARFGLNYKKDGEPAQFNTASGSDTVYILKLSNVKVGDISLNNIDAAVHEGNYPDVILLGNSFLNNISIKRDGQLMQLIK